MSEKRLFIRCNCGSHALELTWDEEFGWLEMAQWHYASSSSPLPFKERLRWIWRILTTGKPWTDSVLLDKKEIEQLKNYLSTL
jgi:hypothetical protein